jgi:iron complex transport system ATP-binding protein
MPAAGSITLDGKALHEISPRQRAQRIGLMAQDDHDEAETTVLEVALLGRLPYLDWWQMESAADEMIARGALTAVGLGGMETRRAASLSGGERRRLAIAALITQQAPLLFLDEPNSHLDLHQQIALLDLLSGLPNRTLVMSLHDVNLAIRYCTHALLLFGEGAACAGPIAQMLEPAVLSTLYRHPVIAHETATGQVFLPA